MSKIFHIEVIRYVVCESYSCIHPFHFSQKLQMHVAMPLNLNSMCRTAFSGNVERSRGKRLKGET